MVGRLSLHPSPYCQHGREIKEEPTRSPMEVGAETSYEELWPSAAPHPTDLSTGQQTEITKKAPNLPNGITGKTFRQVYEDGEEREG